MTAAQRHAEAISALRPDELVGYLAAHSGLPGPRGNLELADAVAGTVDSFRLHEFARSPDEYLALCGAIGLGELLARGDDVLPELHALASDERWRVREGVARGLQRLDGEVLRPIVAAWADDPDPLVQRAAIAAICEPRLLKDPLNAAAALEACHRATRDAARSRVLRQALGYCWSVAIAGSPGPGLTAWAALVADPDADVQWIVRENSAKARLAKLLGSDPAVARNGD